MSSSSEADDAFQRLRAAIESLDPRASEILACHAAIERELDLALEHALPNAKRLRGLGFGHKVSVWAAAQDMPVEVIDKCIEVLLEFNCLRNAVAHGDSPEKVSATLKRLVAALPDDSPHRVRATAGHVAGFIFGALGALQRHAQSRGAT